MSGPTSETAYVVPNVLDAHNKEARAMLFLLAEKSAFDRPGVGAVAVHDARVEVVFASDGTVLAITVAY